MSQKGDLFNKCGGCFDKNGVFGIFGVCLTVLANFPDF